MCIERKKKRTKKVVGTYIYCVIYLYGSKFIFFHSFLSVCLVCVCVVMRDVAVSCELVINYFTPFFFLKKKKNNTKIIIEFCHGKITHWRERRRGHLVCSLKKSRGW